MKKLTVLFLAACMILGMSTIAFASSDVKIKVNGEFLSDAQAILKDGSTLLPVRSVSTALGGEVVWDNDTKTASIKKDGTSVAITIGKKGISINGKTKEISTPAQVISGRTYVPLRALGEALECDITWVNATKTVEISQVDPSEYKAWYEADDNGDVHIKTNINTAKWDEYTVATKVYLTKGVTSWNVKYGQGKFEPFGLPFAFFDDGTIIKTTDVYIFEGRIPDLENTLSYARNPENELAAFSDKLIHKEKLKNKITVNKEYDTPHFAEFQVVTDQNNKKINVATITDKFEEKGQYKLLFITNKNWTHDVILHKYNGTLACTNDLHDYLAYTPGVLRVRHVLETMDEKGNITVDVKMSNAIEKNMIKYVKETN